MSLGMEGRHHRAWGLTGILPAVDSLVDAPAIPARNTTARGSADSPGLYGESGHRLYRRGRDVDWFLSGMFTAWAATRPGQRGNTLGNSSSCQDLARRVKGPRAPGQRNKGKELSCSSHWPRSFTLLRRLPERRDERLRERFFGVGVY